MQVQKQIDLQLNVIDVGKIFTKILPLSSTCHCLAETFCFSCPPPESPTYKLQLKGNYPITQIVLIKRKNKVVKSLDERNIRNRSTKNLSFSLISSM